jgi:hypothetical protein
VAETMQWHAVSMVLAEMLSDISLSSCRMLRRRINLLKRIHVPSMLLKQHERQIKYMLSSNLTDVTA